MDASGSSSTTIRGAEAVVVAVSVRPGKTVAIDAEVSGGALVVVTAVAGHGHVLA